MRNKVFAWAVIGTDGSYIDNLHWYPEEHRKKWGCSQGVKIIKVEIRRIKIKRREKKS